MRPTRRAAPHDNDAVLTSAGDLQDPFAQRSPGLPAYLSALDALERPVLDLASTLGTHPDDVADAENVAFLRRRYDPQEEWSADNAQRSQRQESRGVALREDERLRRERLQASGLTSVCGQG